MGTLFPFLKCLGQKCTILQDFAYTISILSAGGTPSISAVFGPRHQFPLGSPAFYETTNGEGEGCGSNRSRGFGGPHLVGVEKYCICCI